MGPVVFFTIEGNAASYAHWRLLIAASDRSEGGLDSALERESILAAIDGQLIACATEVLSRGKPSHQEGREHWSKRRQRVRNTGGE